MNECISIDRIISKLDEHLHRNDYVSAERHLKYWLMEALAANDGRVELLVRNELMGIYRKLGREEDAIREADLASSRIDSLGISEQVGAATSLLNVATVYKAFGRAEEAINIFGRARAVYERELDETDERLGGLYNNMALALVDLCRFDEAEELYRKAISVMERVDGGAPEVAITYLNMASAAEARLGIEDADGIIQGYLDRAEALLEGHSERDGDYAFVCEKCASVFDYYGRFVYAAELSERSRRIYGQ